MSPQTKTISKVYSNVFKDVPKEFFNLEKYKLKMENIENYALTQRLGRGKYSEVFEAVHLPSKTGTIIKILKPVKMRKVFREIKILQMLKGGVNIIELLGVIDIDKLKMTALVFKKMNHVEFKRIYLTLNPYDTRYYTYELLKALDYCHSKGIMHRDVKPYNIIVDVQQKQLELIDWGLADFYFPEQEYNVRVASRYFKPPELLVEYVYYNYSLDMWSLGCMFASMLFRKDPFFAGSNNYDQLVKIVRVLGSHNFHCYLRKYNIKINSEALQDLSNFPVVKWEQFINSENEYLIDAYALDFLECLLVYDHMERITARDALQHSYFCPLERVDAPGKNAALSVKVKNVNLEDLQSPNSSQVY